MARDHRATGRRRATKLLGVRAVIAQSFERIHRSNLIGMGVVPLQFQEGESWQVFGLRGDETVTISGLSEGLKPRSQLSLEIQRAMAPPLWFRFNAGLIRWMSSITS